MLKWTPLLLLSLLASNADANQAPAPEKIDLKNYSLAFDPLKFSAKTLTIGNQTINYRAYEDVVYVAHPVDAQYQRMNIYIPEAYFQGKTIGNFSAETAPIFFPNRIGGYMPAEPDAPSQGRGAGSPPPMGGQAPENKMPAPQVQEASPNAAFVALSKGYIVASAGARGRSNQDASGTYTGKAPAAIVDLKAAVRYLRYNDKVMLGDAEKIISNGTSAGGALSALLGSSGNNADYAHYLKALGAAEASDAIFAVSAYCPITNLEHADAAYEWQLNPIHDYQKLLISKGTDYQIERKLVKGSLDAEQLKVSEQLEALFPDYINSLYLKAADGTALSLDAQGNGTFKDAVQASVIASAQKALDSGQDLSAFKWLTVANGKVINLDFAQYLAYMGRMKTPPAFDALDLSSGENELFGTDKINAQHFTAFGQEHSSVQASIANATSIKLMNPMNYIGTASTDTAPYWRIRHGTIDKDTSLAIPTILATRLQNKGFKVDFALAWDKPHSGDYDLNELFQWVEQITR